MRLQDGSHPNDVNTWEGDGLSDVGRDSPRRAAAQGENRDTCSIFCFQVTGCEEFPEGNLVSWENTNWFLNSSRGTVLT